MDRDRPTAGKARAKVCAGSLDLGARSRGSALLRCVEDDLRALGNGLLLVETSGEPQYERTRHSHAKCGYTEEARIRDFWAEGDDNVMFRKALNAD